MCCGASRGAGSLAGLLVVHGRSLATAVAARRGARVVTEGARDGHTGSVTAAARVLAREGRGGMLTMPGDIPGRDVGRDRRRCWRRIARRRPSPSCRRTTSSARTPCSVAAGGRAAAVRRGQLLPASRGGAAQRHRTDVSCHCPGSAWISTIRLDLAAFLAHAAVGLARRTLRFPGGSRAFRRLLGSAARPSLRAPARRREHHRREFRGDERRRRCDPREAGR